MAIDQFGLLEKSTFITVQFDNARHGVKRIELRNLFRNDLIADETIRQRYANTMLIAGIIDLLVDFAQINIFTVDGDYLVVVDVGLFVARLGHKHIADLHTVLPRFLPCPFKCFSAG